MTDLEIFLTEELSKEAVKTDTVAEDLGWNDIKEDDFIC